MTIARGRSGWLGRAPRASHQQRSACVLLAPAMVAKRSAELERAPRLQMDLPTGCWALVLSRSCKSSAECHGVFLFISCWLWKSHLRKCQTFLIPMGIVCQQPTQLLRKVCVKQACSGPGVVGMRELHWWQHDDLWKLSS